MSNFKNVYGKFIKGYFGSKVQPVCVSGFFIACDEDTFFKVLRKAYAKLTFRSSRSSCEPAQRLRFIFSFDGWTDGCMDNF